MDEFWFWFLSSEFSAADGIISLAVCLTNLNAPIPMQANVSTPSYVDEIGISLIVPTLQRFIEARRLTNVMREICANEYEKKNKKGMLMSSTLSSTSVMISPSSQSVIDTLCSIPDLLANVLKTRVPYSLTHNAWFVELGQQLGDGIDQMATSASTDNAIAPTDFRTFLSPLGALVTKLTRLNRRVEILDALMPRFIQHVHQLIGASSSSSSLPSSSIIHAYGAIFQSVNVQSMEPFLITLIQWLGNELHNCQQHAASASSSSSSSPSTEVIFAIMRVLFPLTYYNSSSTSSTYFTTLVTKKLFLTRAVTLSPSAIQILIDYIAFISSSLFHLDPASLPSRKLTHSTLIEDVLLDLGRAWAGAGAGAVGDDAGLTITPNGAQRMATSVAVDHQLAIGRCIKCILEKLESEENRANDKAKQSSSTGPKAKKSSIDADLAVDGDDDADIKSLGSFASSPVLPYLLTGVQSRLSSPLLAVRRNAMQIAKVFSRLLGGAENELNFDGEEADEKENQLSAPVAGDDDHLFIDDSDPSKPSTGGVTVTLHSPASIIDPRHLTQANANSSAPTSSPLKAHSLVDDEKDLRKVPLPTFLRPALDMLHKNAESLDHMTAALEALPRLIQKQPADLPLVAPQLASALLNVGSNVFLETHARLAQYRKAALVALCSSMNIQVLTHTVTYLVGEFYSSNHSLGSKLEILEVLRTAAEEMADMKEDRANSIKSASTAPLISEVPSSSSPLIPINRRFYSSSSHSQSVSATLAHHEEIIRQRVEQRTRRWGNTARQKKAETTAALATSSVIYSINRFTPVAHIFFYTLMKPIDQPSALTLLHQHDSLLLIRLIHTISAFLPCSSGLSQALPMVTRSMAKVLMEYLIMHAGRIQRYHNGANGHHQHQQSQDQPQLPSEEIGIRRMIFFALSRILVTYNEKLFADGKRNDNNPILSHSLIHLY